MTANAAKRNSARALFVALLAPLALGACVAVETTAEIAPDAAASRQFALRQGANLAQASVAIVSVEGAPPAIAADFSRRLDGAARARQLAVVDAARARYLVRGYLSASATEDGAEIEYVWDVFTAQKQRVQRLNDVIAVKGAGDDPWTLAGEAVVDQRRRQERRRPRRLPLQHAGSRPGRRCGRTAGRNGARLRAAQVAPRDGPRRAGARGDRMSSGPPPFLLQSVSKRPFHRASRGPPPPREARWRKRPLRRRLLQRSSTRSPSRALSSLAKRGRGTARSAVEGEDGAIPPKRRLALMPVMGALAVIGEDLDHAACRDVAVAAFADHQFQLGLERREAANPLLDVDKANAGDVVGCRA